jgi:ElaB/YqjD/DUF883 family membrane-anchored ribosome-binding protein
MADRELQHIVEHKVSLENASIEADSIYDEIDRTRDSMDRTLEEIQRRLSPGYITHKTIHNIREASLTMYRTTLDTVRDHPIPAAAAGLGIACIIGLAIRDRSRRRESGREDRTAVSNGESPRESRLSESACEQERPGDSHKSIANVAHAAGQSFSRATEAVMDRSRELAHNINDARHNVQHRLQEGALASRDAAQHAFHDHPLLIGISVFAAGIALGAVFPSTRKESQWLGEYRDELVDTAKAKVTRAARTAAQTAAHAARRESLDDPLRLAQQMRGGVLRTDDSTARSMGEEVGRRAGAVVGEAVDAAKEEMKSSPTMKQPPFATAGPSAKPHASGSTERGPR